MLFQPIQDSNPDRPRLADLGLLVIRLFAVATFAYYQLARQFHFAVDFLWDGADWELVGQLAGRGFSSPEGIAVATVGLQIVTLLGVVLGIFTRISALLFALMTGFVLFTPITLSPSLNPQALALYLSIFLGLACGGAGRLSLDHLLADRRARNRAV
jgi:uncharacterized membrane protein YphA (DoxX/SURF4 family)